jgi:hypothetical protein
MKSMQPLDMELSGMSGCMAVLGFCAMVSVIHAGSCDLNSFLFDLIVQWP